MRALYMEDSYLKEFGAKVVEVAGTEVILDQTAFYPTGGGQPHDTGVLERDREEFRVVSVRKKDGKIAHEVDKEGLKVGDQVRGRIDWDRRYKLMRMHTAGHALAAIFHDKAGAKITGHQLDVEKSKVDFNLEEFDRGKIEDFIDEANAKLAEGHEVKISSMPREKVMENPHLVKLATALPPAVKDLRIVEIEGIDIQADGGTHVKDTKEVGTIEVVKMQNKGKANRRVYFTLK